MHTHIKQFVSPIKITFLKKHQKAKLHLNGPCAYFFDDIDRISDDNYEPTHKDILFQRRSTSGIIEQIIESKNDDHEFQLVLYSDSYIDCQMLHTHTHNCR